MFEDRSLGDERSIDGWVVIDAGRDTLSQVATATRPCYVVLADSDLTLWAARQR